MRLRLLLCVCLLASSATSLAAAEDAPIAREAKAIGYELAGDRPAGPMWE